MTVRSSRMATVLGIAVLAGITGCTPNTAPAPEPEKAVSVKEVRDMVVITDCLKAGGYNVTYSPTDHSISKPSDPSQAASYASALARCKAGPDFEPNFLIGERPKDPWAFVYEYETDVAACLRGEGFDVPEIPSLQTFINRRQGPDPWFAYSYLPQIDREQMTALESACPQTYRDGVGYLPVTW